MLVLEPLEAARARGARILGEIVGFGMSADAAHITQPSADGAAKAMRAALHDARLAPEQIGYINAHGTGNAGQRRHRDRRHPRRFRRPRRTGCQSAPRNPCTATPSAPPPRSRPPPLSSPSRDGVLPPTANFTEPDPECDLDVVPNRARPAQVEFALSNSFAFGGLNAVLAFAKFGD